MAKQEIVAEQSLKALNESVSSQLAKGAHSQDVIRHLVARGWPEASARQFVANVRQTLDVFSLAPRAHDERARIARQVRRRIIRGAACVAIGLGLVVAGLAVQDVSTSLFVFATGVVLIVFESVDLIAGLAGWSQRHK